MTTFQFSTELAPEFVQIHFIGSLLEKHQAMDLLEEVDDFIDEGKICFLLNFSKFEYLNSSGLGVLLGILARARKAGGEVLLTAVNDKLNKLLVMTRLDQVFAKASNEEEANALFNQITTNKTQLPENGH